jgi:hypothetical protein
MRHRPGLTAAARQAVAAAARAGFADSLNAILLIGAAIAAIAAITSLTLIRGRDFAAVPAAPGTEADLPAAEPRHDMILLQQVTRSPDDHR